MTLSDDTHTGTIPTPKDNTIGEEARPAADTLNAILKSEAQFPPRAGEIVEGPIISRGTAAIFVDLGTRGTGLIYGREFFLARDALRGKKVGDIISAKVIDPENAEGYVELSVNAAGREIAWNTLRRALAEKETRSVTIEAANRGGLIATVKGIKGFLPVSHLAPDHYPHVEGGDKEKILDALKKFIGKTLNVKIINLDAGNDKLILSERAVIEEELRAELRNFHVGDIVDGTISGIVDFGLFIRFGPDEKLEGLAHISELSWGKMENIRQAFKIGERVKAKIIDMQGDRVSLSLKALTPQPVPPSPERTEAAEIAGSAETAGEAEMTERAETEETMETQERAERTETEETAEVSPPSPPAEKAPAETTEMM